MKIEGEVMDLGSFIKMEEFVQSEDIYIHKTDEKLFFPK